MDVPNIQWFQDRAGKRTTPYPHELPAWDVPRCAAGCGTPLAGERGNDGLPRRYCSDTCRTRHASRLQFARMEAARHERRQQLSAYE